MTEVGRTHFPRKIEMKDEEMLPKPHAIFFQLSYNDMVICYL